MPIIEYSKRDILRGTIVDPAWYRCRVDSVGQKPSKDGQSVNYPVELTVLFNGENGSTKFAEVPVEFNFNSKAIGMSKGFMAAFGVNVEAGVRYDLAAAQGKDLDVFIANKTHENRILNDVPGQFRAAKAEVIPVVTA